jgi:ribose transport system ATP-binding protein
MAALVVSPDLEEVVQISDRVIVLRDGMIAAILSGAEKTQERVLAVATGADQAQAEGAIYVNR